MLNHKKKSWYDGSKNKIMQIKIAWEETEEKQSWKTGAETKPKGLNLH